ncbi:MAG: ROK family protein [Kiritimatiellae bacterium]|nr:ROK family protein [Kiritimatiellia bacterium]
MKPALGVDFGGTAVKIGLVNAQGRVLGEDGFATAGVRGVERWLDEVAAAAERLGVPAGRWSRELSGIGVGVPGFVDFERGFIHNLTNVPGWTAVHLARLMRERFGVPVVVDNDCNAMAFGECQFGAGRRYRHAVFLTLGTGVGGGIVLDGRVWRGAYSMAGEIGHVPIDLHGVRTPTGRGGLEEYVGNRQIVRRARRLLRHRRSILPDLVGGNLRELTPRHLADAAAKGDAVALEVFDYMADCLATALAGITYLLQPEAFIVGGGVAAAGDVLFGPLRRHLTERLSPFFAKYIRVEPAALGNRGGMIGAAALVLKSNESSPCIGPRSRRARRS